MAMIISHYRRASVGERRQPHVGTVAVLVVQLLDFGDSLFGSGCTCGESNFLQCLRILSHFSFQYILVRKLGEYSFRRIYKHDDETNSASDAQWPEAIGWIVALIPVLPIPLFMIYIVTKTCIQGPGITYWEVRARVISFRAHQQTTRSSDCARS